MTWQPTALFVQWSCRWSALPASPFPQALLLLLLLSCQTCRRSALPMLPWLQVLLLLAQVLGH